MTRGSPESTHILKVTLRHVQPPIWRRIAVASDMKLSVLGGLLEASMGWDGSHLHAFRVGKIRYEMPTDDLLGGFSARERPRDERTARLDGVLSEVGAELVWDYDFGDGWEHDVVVEAIEPRRPPGFQPECSAGERACPPEDCGGPWGYGDLLQALADPQHERHEELTEWLGVRFDPDAFDPSESTVAMRRRIGLRTG